MNKIFISTCYNKLFVPLVQIISKANKRNYFILFSWSTANKKSLLEN